MLHLVLIVPRNTRQLARVPEGVNELEMRVVIPLLASPQGGVAEQIKKHRGASVDCEAGVVFRWIIKGKTTPAASTRWLREIFLMTQPPLLAVVQGGE